MTRDERTALCRRIAASGGRTTLARHGRAHFAALGRRGFDALAAKLGDRGYARDVLGRKGRMEPYRPSARNYPKEPTPPGAPCGRIVDASAEPPF